MRTTTQAARAYEAASVHRSQREQEAAALAYRLGVEEVPAGTASGDKLKAELDDLLDEIDDVLETNAEDFVKSYVQKGGE